MTARHIDTLPLPVDEAELPLYRERTLAMLRRYFRMAIETGRLPSLLGREFFRARVTSYRLHTIEDVVIFVHDVERCLERLNPTSQKLIVHITLQGHTEEETAKRLQWTRRHVVRRYPEAIDELSGIFLRLKLLQPAMDAQLPRAASSECAQPETACKRTVGRVSACQDANFAVFAASA